jgi:hypothetical protein
LMSNADAATKSMTSASSWVIWKRTYATTLS